MRLTKETNLYRDHAVKNGVDDAAKVATNYLDYDQQTGLSVGYIGSSERAVITSDGMEVYDGFNDQIAQFKSVTRIGLVTEGNLQLDYHSLQLQDLDGTTYVHLSDLRGRDKYTTMTDTYTYTSRDHILDYFARPMTADDILSVTVDGVEASTSDYHLNTNNGNLYFDNPQTVGSEIVCVYRTPYIFRVYTFGTRASDSALGDDSFTSGWNNEASGSNAVAFGDRCIAKGDDSSAMGYKCEANGNYSHSEGSSCKALSKYAHAEGNACEADWMSHAEGSQCKVYANCSHVEGEHCEIQDGNWTYYGTHAEGFYCVINAPSGPNSTDGAHVEGYYCEVVKGSGAHAEGNHCKANGQGNHAEGSYTIASGLSQHVSGKYNVEVTTSSIIFIVGCGTSSTRKNGLTLDTSGNMTIAGTLTQSSDKRLKHHRAYLSDQQDQVNEFINRLKPAWFEKDEQKHLGFYAQDVQQTDRWQCMVDNDTNGYLTLGYTEIIAPLVAYCQNLEQKVESLEQRIERLEQLLNQ